MYIIMGFGLGSHGV